MKDIHDIFLRDCCPIRMHLQNKGVDAECVRFLISKHHQKIKQINLIDNQIGDKGMKELANAKWINLQIIEHNNISSEGIKWLVQPQWQHITYMQLNSNFIGNKGCKYLSQSSWKSLQFLFISKNNIENKGIHHLTKSQWPKLKQLNINNNFIGDEGLYYLKHWKLFVIQRLNIHCNPFSYQSILSLLTVQSYDLAYFVVAIDSFQQIVGCSSAKCVRISSMFLNRFKGYYKIITANDQGLLIYQ